MRLWSLHPAYLDSKGLVALWREGLLAKAALFGQTKGYKNHPQLDRFKKHPNLEAAINSYLWEVFYEAERRGYNFNREKLGPTQPCEPIPVSLGQLAYEFEHLQRKLQKRAPDRYRQNLASHKVIAHPLMEITSGDIATWEIVKKNGSRFKVRPDVHGQKR